MYIHCSQGHGRTGTVCALLLAIAYHISGPHAILLYQALHDVASKAFRRELVAADVTIEFESPDGTLFTKTVSNEGVRSFSHVAALAATLGVEPSDAFMATRVDGEYVRVRDDETLGLLVDGLRNVERPESVQPVLRLTATPFSLAELARQKEQTAPTDARKVHFAAVSAAAAAASHSVTGQHVPPDARSSAEAGASQRSEQRSGSETGKVQSGEPAKPSAEAVAAIAKLESEATHGMSVDEGMNLVRLMSPGCDYCHALCPDQIRQVLRLLQVATRHILKAVDKDKKYRVVMAKRAELAEAQRKQEEEAAEKAAEAEMNRAKALQEASRKRRRRQAWRPRFF